MGKKQHKTPRRPTPGRAVYIPRLRSNPEVSKLVALLGAIVGLPPGRATEPAQLQMFRRLATGTARQQRQCQRGFSDEVLTDDTPASNST